MKIAKVLMVVLAVSLCCTAVNAQTIACGCCSDGSVVSVDLGPDVCPADPVDLCPGFVGDQSFTCPCSDPAGVSCKVLPPNVGDDCATALAGSCNGTVTLDPASDLSPGAGLNGSCIGGGGVDDVWATFVADEASVRLRTDVGDSIGTDSDFVVFSVTQGDTCNSAGWSEVGCSEDEGEGFNGDIVIDGLTVGDTYLIQVGHWSDAYAGSFELHIECPATGAVCGDGVTSVIPGDEECDGDDTDNCLLTCDSDCTCTPVPTPMLPKWGLIGLALMLVVGGVGIFGRGRAAVA